MLMDSAALLFSFRRILQILAITCLVATLAACNEDRSPDHAVNSCIECHQLVVDEAHNLACTSCHKGDSRNRKKDIAHLNLIQQPSHPDNMAEACGSCHADKVDNIFQSLHFTLRNSTNLFRDEFGATTNIATFLDTPETNDPSTPLELANDLLRRRCFRCHPYSKGDDYPAVTRGTGCAACHLSFYEGKLTSHSFQSPDDSQCLSCHYGNYVGFDYYGRFEHDFNDEYRTPYTTANKHFRPFGVEYHQLKPDIHQQSGMVCIDCHSGQTLMNGEVDRKKISCERCHLDSLLTKSPPAGIEKGDNSFFLHSKSGNILTVPTMKHPSHFDQPDKIACQVCHAQWTFGDFGKHFLRSDVDDFDSWYLLATQANSELEKILTNNADFEKTELPPVMSDKITGSIQPGLWYKGFTIRRWETVLLGRDTDGTITTVRPMLDFMLSWIDEEEEIRFDSVAPPFAKHMGLRPYTPHTTGPAGLFFNERIRFFIKLEKMQQN